MEPIGNQLDALGVHADLNKGDLISSAVVVLSVLPEGSQDPHLCMASSEAMTWIEQAGLLILASNIANTPPLAAGSDE